MKQKIYLSSYGGTTSSLSDQQIYKFYEAGAREEIVSKHKGEHTKKTVASWMRVCVCVLKAHPFLSHFRLLMIIVMCTNSCDLLA